MSAAAWAAALAARAAADPDELAVMVDGGEDLSFGSWEQRSSAVAAGLVSRGVGSGHRVGLRFDPAHWAGFAVARLALLKAGTVAVLVPAGLSDADAARIVRHSQAVGVLAPRHLALAPAMTSDLASVWVSEPGELEALPRASGEGWGGHAPAPSALAELIYPQRPLARPRPVARTHAGLVAPGGPLPPGWLVHAWAPGSLGGQLVLARVLAGPGTSAASLARFSPDRFVRLAARLEASTCGFPPGVAAALAAADLRPLPGVSSVLVSRHQSSPPLRGLASAFPQATVVDVHDDDPAPLPQAETAPVGPSQLGMLWHEQLSPGSFNLPSLVRRYRGALDVDALGRALAELVRRHEPLRTTFELVGRPVQIVGSAPGLSVTDLSQLAPPERDAEAARLIGEATRQPFDLVEGPLFAPRLLRLGVDDHVLVVRLHHTAFDDWSVDVFRRELSALYAASLPNSDATAPPEPPARFVEVCRRLEARLDGEAGDSQRAYWRTHMAGAPLAVQLDLGEPHQLGPDRPGAGEPLRVDLPAHLARAVRTLAPRLRATPFMTVLSAFEVLLARRSGLDDLVLASVVAARDSTAAQRMIGCFTKKVLLRVRLEGDPTFAQLVTRTRTTVLGALAHQDLPFEAVVGDTLGRAAAAHGLAAQVQVVFQGETPQPSRLVLPKVDVGPYEVAPATRRERHFSARDEATAEQAAVWGDGALSASFLLLSLLELPDGMALVARGVFHRPAAQRLLDALGAVLTEVAESPDRRLSDLGVTPAAPAGVDEIDLLGLRLSRPRIEAGLASCPGVADVAVTMVDGAVDRRMVAYFVADGRRPPPSLAGLRAALWTAHPGSPWPAAAVAVDKLPYLADGRLDAALLPAPPPEPDDAPDPRATLLSALWVQAGGAGGAPAASYWQDFTFLQALADARAAGLPITDEQVSRCRTPEMLAAALGPLAS